MFFTLCNNLEVYFFIAVQCIQVENPPLSQHISLWSPIFPEYIVVSIAMPLRNSIESKNMQAISKKIEDQSVIIHLSIHPSIHPSINLYIQTITQLLLQFNKFLLMSYYMFSSTYLVINGQNSQKATKYKDPKTAMFSQSLNFNGTIHRNYSQAQNINLEGRDFHITR